MVMARQFLQSLFRNRETGAITVAQVPNLLLWIVIAAAILRWLWSATGRTEVILTIIFQERSSSGQSTRSFAA